MLYDAKFVCCNKKKSFMLNWDADPTVFLCSNSYIWTHSICMYCNINKHFFSHISQLSYLELVTEA